MLCISAQISSRLLVSHSTLDLVLVELLTAPPIVLCCVYIPPNPANNYFKSTLHFLESLSQQFSKLLIVGDFNAPDIDWATLTSHTTNSNLLCDLIFRLNLTQLITFPTHIKGNTLDLLFTNIDQHIHRISSTTSTAIASDHLIVLFELNCSIHPHKSPSRYVYDYSKADFNGLNDYLLKVDFSTCFNCRDVDVIWNHLKSVIIDACTIYIPKVKLRSSQHPRWFTPLIRHHLHCIHSLRRKAKKDPHLETRRS